MKESKGFDYHEFDQSENMEYTTAASVTESTGMMPTPPQTQAQRQSYQELGTIIIPKNAPGKKKNREKRHAKEDGQYPVL